MTADRDPMLQGLFDIARRDPAGEQFVARIMSDINRRRRWTMFARLFIGVVLLVGAWLVAVPVQDAVNLMIQILPESLIELEHQRAARVLAPLNSIAGLVAVGVLGLGLALRKLLS